MVVGFNKMKAIAILLILIASGIFVTGCTKSVPATQNNLGNVAAAEDTSAADITLDTTSTNPDIGTLDNISVSDELPQ